MRAGLFALLLACVCHAQPGHDYWRDYLDVVRFAQEATQRMADTQSITFDNGATVAGGLTWSVARSAAAYQEDGTSIGANTARYANAKLLAGAPADPVNLDGFTGAAFRPLASGLDDDGTTPILVVRKGSANLDVHVRTDPEAYYNDSDTTGSYRTTLGTNGDILNGQTASGGGTAAIANHEFLPSAAKVWKGLVFIGCDHLYDDGGGFDSVGCALAYTTADRLADGTNPWILQCVTEVANIGPSAHVQQWSMTLFEISATRAVIGLCDYGTSTREGGNAQIIVVDLDSNGDPTFTPVRLFDNYRSSADDEHFHTLGLIIDSSGNWQVMVSLGDDNNRNRVLHRSLSAANVSAGNFGNGSTYSEATYGDTGISGSYVIEQPHANWSAESTVWGGTGTSNQSLRSNQFIGAAQYDAACTAFLGATDETNNCILKVTWDESNSVPIFESLFVPAATSACGDGMVNFIIDGKPGGPYVCGWAAGGSWNDSETGGSGTDHLESAVMYSPDGDNWALILDRQADAQFAAVQHAGKLFLGATSGDQARYLPSMPQTRLARPLQIASSPANSMDTGIAASLGASVDSQVTITDLATDGSDLPASFNSELPPCDRGPMMLFEIASPAGASAQHLGNWDIIDGTGANLATATNVCVVAWVRAVPYDGTNEKSTASVYWYLRDTGTGTPSFPAGRVTFDSGQWTPVVIYLNTTQWDAAANDSTTLRVHLRSENNGSNSNPTQFVLCWEGVYIDGNFPAHHGIAAGASANTEVLTVSGIASRTKWSVYAETVIPWDQWDNRSGGETPGSGVEAGSSIATLISLFKLTGGASDTFEPKADLDDNRIVGVSDAASTNGTSNKKWWRRGDTIPLVITCDGTQIIMYYETTDGDIASVTVADAITFTSITSVDPLWHHRFVIKNGVDQDPELSMRNRAAHWDPVVPRSRGRDRRR